jgi:hypothetical protein
MFPPDVVGVVAALFIVGMAWLRTRMHYVRNRSRERAAHVLGDAARPARLTLTRAGQVYFASLLAVLAVGWFAAPPLAWHLAVAVPIAPTLARVIWFLAAYYLFIPVHRALRARGVEVFKATVARVQDTE